MIKKLILILLLSLTLFLASCGNKTIFDTNYTFEHAYVKIHDQWQMVKIDKWTDYDGEQLQLILKDGNTIVVHSLNVVLVSGDPAKFLETFVTE